MSTSFTCIVRTRVLWVATLLSVLTACGGGGGGGGGGASTAPVTPPAETYSAKSGVAQKGPLIKGSTVTAQELDSNLSPTGTQYTYQTTSDLGTFSPTSTFTSQYIGLLASGYYFDEVADSVSSGPVTLNAYSDLAIDSVLNVNLLTTLEYQRIQNLVTKSNMTFAAARTQAETEVLAALNIPAGSYGSFDSLDVSDSTDGDHILAAISALFVYGNSAGSLSQLIASFQNDIGANGVITSAATTATLVAAAKGMDPSAVAANLTQFYASDRLSFTAGNISDWIAQSSDGVIGRFAFLVSDATPSTALTFPPYVVSQFAGMQVSVTAGQLSINGTPVSGTVSFNAGDVVTLLPSVGDFPNGVLISYLVSGKTNLARVSFVSGLVSIAVTPDMPGVPLGVTQQFKATGTFSDTSMADLTNSVAWTSGTPAVATVNSSSGLATVLTVGSTVITATSGSVSGSTTLSVTPAALVSIAVTPNPITIGAGRGQQLTARGTYSDGTTQDVTTSAKWTSDTPSVATISPSTGLAMGVSAGTATISVTIGSVTGTAPLSVAALVSIAITPNPITLGVGGSQQLTATGTYSDRSTQDVTTVAHWTSDTPSVATVGASTGLATGVLVGSARISATIGSITASVTSNVYSGLWRPTGSMLAGEAYQTATLLQNGTVLAAGGVGNGSGPASAAIYTPASGTWTATGNFSTGRTDHTATLLPNGKVLVAGGLGFAAPNQSLASAEIYDPASGTWTLTASMANARWGHTATLLPNGTVLVAGGAGAVPTLASAEIYDPVSGTWTSTGSLTTPREYHTATLLPNGTVLVAGGSGAGSGINTITAGAEIYDPGTGVWTPTGSLITARMEDTATLLPNGTVLVAGGTPDLNAVLSSAEIYNPSSGTWTPTSGMTTPRLVDTATLLPSGKVLVAGGCNCSAPVSNAELYDPVAGTWTATASMSVDRSDHSATLLPNGSVLIAGGFPDLAPGELSVTLLSSAETYQ